MELLISMNILHIGCAYFPYQGGSTHRLSHLVKNYKFEFPEDDLHLVTHISGNGRSEEDYPFTKILRHKEINSLGRDKILLAFLREVDPQVVVLHNSRVLMNWVIFYRKFFPKCQIVLEIHSFRDSHFYQKWANKLLYRFVDDIVVLSKGAHQTVVQRYGKHQLTIVSNGLEISNKNSSKATGKQLNTNSITFSYIGSFFDWQGVLVIADAARELGVEFWKQHRLYLVGDGPAHAEVKRRLGAELLALPNVKIFGWQPTEALTPIFEETDFLLAPRPSNMATETVIPLKVVESIQSGIPLIASSVGGLTELLNNDTAIFVIPGSINSLAEAMSKFPDSDAYRLMSNRLLSLAAEVPTWRASAKVYKSIFAQFHNKFKMIKY